MENKKTKIISLFVIIGITFATYSIIGFWSTTLRDEQNKIVDNTEYFRGIEVSHELGNLTEPIEILNPKGFNVLYNGSDHIIFDYRTAENVTATEFILNGLAPQPIPDNKTISKPRVGNHSLVLVGINGTGESCSSKMVYFYYCDHPGSLLGIPGVLGAPPDVKDLTDKGFVSKVSFAGIEKGINANLPFSSKIFLEGPQRNIIDQSFPTTPYTKSIELKFEYLQVYIPYMIIRSEPWYNHTIWVMGPSFIGDSIWGTFSWGSHARDGDVRIIYLKTELVHIYGSIEYWNDEVRKYDVIEVVRINFENTWSENYESNELILEMPLTHEIIYDTDVYGDLREYYDKIRENDTPIGGSYRERDWIDEQGFEGQVFLGYYDHDEMCPVPVRFSIPLQLSMGEERLPTIIEHEFFRTHVDPDDYNYNFRGYENTFSYNIYSL